MNTFINLLRKLGILRYGKSSGRYTSAKDMPTEFLMPGVFNAKKETLQPEDLQGKGGRWFWALFLLILLLGGGMSLFALFGSKQAPTDQLIATGSGKTVSEKPGQESAASPAVAPRAVPATPTAPAPRLATCTSTTADSPSPLAGWKVRLYSAPIADSATPSADVAQFSFAELKKKEGSSFYVELRREGDGLLTGYDTTLELCNANNQALATYVTANQKPSDVAGANITASEHSLHAGAYAWAPGTYRADVYVRDLQGVWHLVARRDRLDIGD